MAGLGGPVIDQIVTPANQDQPCEETNKGQKWRGFNQVPKGRDDIIVDCKVDCSWVVVGCNV
jgi:hypothetical protein